MLRRFLKKIIPSKKSKSSTNVSNIQIGKESIIGKAKVLLRKNITARKCLVIGENSLVDGLFVFENENGIISIGDRTFIGGGGKFICVNQITVGNDVLISWGCTIMDNNAHSLKWSERKNDVSDWKRGVEENKIGEYKNWQICKKCAYNYQ